MVTDNYKIELYISNQWVEQDILFDSFSIREQLHSKLKPVDSSASITFSPNQVLYNQLKLIDKNNIPVKITKNGNVIYTGYLRKQFDITKTQKLEPLKAEIVSPSFLLKRKIGQDIEYKNKSVSFILTDLLTKAGITGSTLPNITAIIPGLFIEAGKSKYHDIISQLLFEYGYVGYFNKSGNFTTYNLNITNITTTKVFNNTNTLNTINQTKSEEEIEKVIVDWTATKTLSNAIAFSDTSNAQNGYKCFIELAPNSFYLKEELLADLDSAEGEILSVDNLTLDIVADAGIQVLKFEPKGNKVLISIKNTNSSVSKFIRKLDIKAGTAVVKLESNNKSIVINNPNTEKIEEVSTKYIFDKVYGDNLVNILANYYKYSDFKYKIQSKTDYQIGDIVTISDSHLGINKAIIITKTTNHFTDLINYELEAIDEYQTSTVENEYYVKPPTPSPVEDAVIYLEEQISQIFQPKLTLNTKTVTRERTGEIVGNPLIVKSLINPTTEYLGRYRIYITTNDVDYTLVYESTDDEGVIAYSIPSYYEDHFTYKIKVELYKAGGFNEILTTDYCNVLVSVSNTPIYWGALLVPVESESLAHGDYYFDKRAPVDGGGKLKIWNSSQWVDFSTEDPRYGQAFSIATTDIMVWCKLYGVETFTAINAIFESIAASKAFITFLEAQEVNITGKLRTGVNAATNALVAIRDKSGIYQRTFTGTGVDDLKVAMDTPILGNTTVEITAPVNNDTTISGGKLISLSPSKECAPVGRGITAWQTAVNDSNGVSYNGVTGWNLPTATEMGLIKPLYGVNSGIYWTNNENGTQVQVYNAVTGETYFRPKTTLPQTTSSFGSPYTPPQGSGLVRGEPYFYNGKMYVTRHQLHGTTTEKEPTLDIYDLTTGALQNVPLSWTPGTTYGLTCPTSAKWGDNLYFTTLRGGVQVYNLLTNTARRIPGTNIGKCIKDGSRLIGANASASDNNPSPALTVFDMATETISQQSAVFPVGSTTNSGFIAEIINGKICLVQRYGTTMWILNKDTFTIERTITTAASISWFQTIVSYQGKIYMFGVNNNPMYIYDYASNTITTKTLPSGILTDSYKRVVFVYDQKIYFIVEDTGFTQVRMAYYDPYTDSFTDVSSIPRATYVVSNGIGIHDDTVYILPNSSSTLITFRAGAKSWFVRPNNTTRRYRFKENNGVWTNSSGAIIPYTQYTIGLGVKVYWEGGENHVVGDSWIFYQDELRGMSIRDAMGNEYVAASNGTLTVRKLIVTESSEARYAP